jgi:plastocyanin
VRRLLFAALPLALLVVPAHAATTQVAIRGFAFEPSTTRVAPGDTVRWTNHDGANHTVTGDNEITFRSGVLAQNQSYERTFLATGSFPYRCDIHPSMRGTVTVQAAGGTTTSTTSSTTTTTRPATTSTTGRTTTTLAPGESAVTAPRDRTTTTTSSTMPGETTTTVLDESTTTTTTDDDLAASVGDDDGDSEPTHAGPTALAALLLAGVAGSTAFAVKRGL